MSVSPTMLVNGQPVSAVDPLYRGLAYGDGLFRTIRVAGGKVIEFHEHSDRYGSMKAGFPDI